MVIHGEVVDVRHPGIASARRRVFEDTDPPELLSEVSPDQIRELMHFISSCDATGSEVDQVRSPRIGRKDREDPSFRWDGDESLRHRSTLGQLGSNESERLAPEIVTHAF
jgi:hypothetical protein